MSRKKPFRPGMSWSRKSSRVWQRGLSEQRSALEGELNQADRSSTENLRPEPRRYLNSLQALNSADQARLMR
jgi:hypothetical protein